MQLRAIHRPIDRADHTSPKSGGLGPIGCRMVREADGRIRPTTHSQAAMPSAHRVVIFVLAMARRAVNGWVAAYLALVERRAAAWTLSADL
jgi:hypothetical protein